jgi:hypothetical protein
VVVVVVLVGEAGSVQILQGRNKEGVLHEKNYFLNGGCVKILPPSPPNDL